MNFKLYPLAFLVFSLSLTPQLLQAQGRFGNQLADNNLKVTSSLKGYLYNGIDNYIRMSANLTDKYGKIHIKTTNGKVLHDSNNMLIVIPERPGNVCLTFYTLTGLDSNMIGYRYYTVKNIPDPLLTIDNKPINTPTTLSKKLLAGCDSLGIYISDDIVGSEKWFSISEFELGYNYGGFHISQLNLTNKVSQKTKEIIKMLGPNHAISIKVSMQTDGRVQKYLPIYRINIY